MAYQRKTRDEYDVQQYYGDAYGWETVCTETSEWDAVQAKKDYLNNQPFIPVRIVKRRVPINE